MKEMSHDKLNAYLEKIDTVIANGTYKDNWESLQDHKVPTWYKKAKFGIFLHWGVFSVPAFGSEWYPRWMYYKDTGFPFAEAVRAHHLKTYGETKDFGYRKFVPMLTAEHFDAHQWVSLFKEAGAKFVMPMAEHHDGFQMYGSELSRWNAVNMGPHKDTLGLLKNEIEKQGMVFATSSHRAEHYWFMGGMRKWESDFDPEVVKYGDLYWPSNKEPFPFDPKDKTKQCQDQVSDVKVDTLYLQDWLARSCEIVDKYQPKDVLFDWWIQVEPFKPYLKKFAAYYYNRALEWNQEVTINYKNDAFGFSTAVRGYERGQLTDISPVYWQSNTSLYKNSWCYTEQNEYKEPQEILQDLIDVVSKNGSFLLNLGPKADGTIPPKDVAILKKIGAWLKLNGEGIYDSHYWKIYGEGPTKTPVGHFSDGLRKPYTTQDVRFTYKNSNIYAFVLKWPEDGKVKISTFGVGSKVCNALIKNVEVIGSPDGCSYKREQEYLEVSAPSLKSDYPVCIKIRVD